MAEEWPYMPTGSGRELLVCEDCKLPRLTVRVSKPFNIPLCHWCYCRRTGRTEEALTDPRLE